MENKTRNIIDSVESLEKALKKLRAAQEKFATYSQEQVDKIFFAAATAANQQRLPLAHMPVEETGMGIVDWLLSLLQRKFYLPAPVNR